MKISRFSVILFAVLLVSMVSARPVDPADLGKGIWISDVQDAINRRYPGPPRNAAELVAYCRDTLQVDFIAVKCAAWEDLYNPNLPFIATILNAARSGPRHLHVFGIHKYGAIAGNGELQAATDALAIVDQHGNGLDGWIVLVQEEVRSGHDAAIEYYMQRVRPLARGFLAYAPPAMIDNIHVDNSGKYYENAVSNANLNYGLFQFHSDAVMPILFVAAEKRKYHNGANPKGSPPVPAIPRVTQFSAQWRRAYANGGRLASDPRHIIPIVQITGRHAYSEPELANWIPALWNGYNPPPGFPYRGICFYSLDFLRNDQTTIRDANNFENPAWP